MVGKVEYRVGFGWQRTRREQERESGPGLVGFSPKWKGRRVQGTCFAVQRMAERRRVLDSFLRRLNDHRAPVEDSGRANRED